ncbi:MAG: Mov34/MPN/PAD-1 family protein, partial [Actinomycetota bacterium]
MTDRLRLSRPIVDEMVAHCVAGRPNEACGILAANSGEIVKVFRMSNASASPLRYSLDPKEQLAAYNKIEEEGWDLGGVFHSHTRTEAYPSPTDVRLAAEDVPYVIVSLAAAPPSVRAFRIVKDGWTDATGEIV